MGLFVKFLIVYTVAMIITILVTVFEGKIKGMLVKGKCEGSGRHVWGLLGEGSREGKHIEIVKCKKCKKRGEVSSWSLSAIFLIALPVVGVMFYILLGGIN